MTAGSVWAASMNDLKRVAASDSDPDSDLQRLISRRLPPRSGRRAVGEDQNF